MTDNDASPGQVTGDREPSDRATTPSLVVFGADDELACVDETCLPDRTPE